MTLSFAIRCVCGLVVCLPSFESCIVRRSETPDLCVLKYCANASFRRATNRKSRSVSSMMRFGPTFTRRYASVPHPHCAVSSCNTFHVHRGWNFKVGSHTDSMHSILLDCLPDTSIAVPQQVHEVSQALRATSALLVAMLCVCVCTLRVQ